MQCEQKATFKMTEYLWLPNPLHLPWTSRAFLVLGSACVSFFSSQYMWWSANAPVSGQKVRRCKELTKWSCVCAVTGGVRVMGCSVRPLPPELPEGVSAAAES